MGMVLLMYRGMLEGVDLKTLGTGLFQSGKEH